VVAYIGLKPVLRAFETAGIGGFAVFCAYALALYPLLGGAWFLLLPGLRPACWRAVTWGRMVREAAAEVLPFSQVGGIVIGARACMLHGLTPALAFGSTL